MPFKGEMKASSSRERFDIIDEYARREGEDLVAKVLEKGLIVGLANHTVLVRQDEDETGRR